MESSHGDEKNRVKSSHNQKLKTKFQLLPPFGSSCRHLAAKVGPQGLDFFALTHTRSRTQLTKIEPCYFTQNMLFDDKKY